MVYIPYLIVHFLSFARIHNSSLVNSFHCSFELFCEHAHGFCDKQTSHIACTSYGHKREEKTKERREGRQTERQRQRQLKEGGRMNAAKC